MENSLIIDAISKKGLQTYLSSRIFDKLYFVDYFPFKPVTSLKVETLIGAAGNRVAADIVSYDSSAPEKKRPVHDVMKYDIPPIRIKRKMSETNLNDFFTLMRLADEESQRRAIDMIFDDVDFVVNGILARLEWMGLQVLSCGLLSLSTTNNAGIITDTTVDFQLPAANKEYIGSSGGTAGANYYWTTATKATNNPIIDIESVCAEAGTAGVKFEKILMNRSKWVAFRESAEVQAFVAPYLVYGGTAARRAPSLNVVNEALAGYELPPIEVIDTRVTIERKNGVQASVDPWLDSSSTDKYVTFLPIGHQGNMFHCPTAEEQAKPPQAVHSKKGPILVSKYSETDPVAEYTVGLLNAFPSWPTIDKTWILNTESHTSF